MKSISSIIINEFQKKINGIFVPNKRQLEELDKISQAFEDKLIKKNSINISFEEIVNEKLEINKGRIKKFIDCCAENDITFNYHQKNLIQHAMDSKQKDLLLKIETKSQYINIIGNLIKEEQFFENGNYVENLNAALSKLENPEPKQALLSSLFARFVFEYFDKSDLYRYFSKDSTTSNQSYIDFLHNIYPLKFEGKSSLSYINIDIDCYYQNYEEIRDSVIKEIKRKFDESANYSYLAIRIPYSEIQWNLYSDFVLYAEKHREVLLQSGYFHPDKIESATKNYIDNIDIEEARFNISNEGYNYLDCFVTAKSEVKETNNNPYDLVLIFQKCKKDEDIIPCPACRSFDVRGNSYPKINVKSWECQNPFCPDRSKSNRGKRYSLESIIKQNGILNEDNKIEKDMLRKWRNDILKIENDDEIVQMLVKFFSTLTDEVELISFKNIEKSKQIFNRSVHNIQLKVESNNLFKEFLNSSFFKRFLVEKDYTSPNKGDKWLVGQAKILVGDSFNVLADMRPDTVDAAVTSPPYYNAKSYSNWDNIYNYLYDMYNINRELYKVLKPGSVYLYNIFDYFDNENSVVFSAMGKKRMILGAYMIMIFREIGFNIVTNVIWNKGEIEGKRNFNQGNDYPYYQMPFNAWEHIFVLTKGEDTPETKEIISGLPNILYQKPVFKMKNGINIAKHEAPFPEKLPEILISLQKINSTVLDPFAGSFTTALVAEKYNVKSISIEYKEEYCELGISRLKDGEHQTRLL